MATRSLRNRVSSRQASPTNGVPLEADVPEHTEDGDFGRMEGLDEEVWVEPPMRKLPPSYQDHKGLERVGVLELQQPLGERPTNKMMQRLKINPPRASPRPTLLATDGGVTPGADSERQDIPSPIEIEESTEPTHLDSLQEGGPTAIPSPPRGRPAKRDIAEMRHSINPEEEATPSPVNTVFSSSTPQLHKPISIQEHLRQDRVQNYVERAITEAEEKGDQGLVPGLKKIREDAFHKRELWSVLDAIAHNQPSEQQLSVFKRFIKKGVKRHRRNTITPSNAGVDSPVTFADHPPVSAIDPGNPTNPVTTFTSPFRPRPSSSHLQPGQPKSTGASPSSRRHKMSSAIDKSPGKKHPDGERRRRSGSASSTSSLSSAKSLPEELVPPPNQDGEAAVADERPLKNGLARQANDKNRTRANAHPASKHPFSSFQDVGKLTGKKLKKQNQNQEPDVDAAEIEKKRQKFIANSFQDYNYQPRPEVQERHQLSFEDGDESDDYEILIPAPIIHPSPVKAASNTVRAVGNKPESDIQNGTSRKRRFDEMEEEDDDIPTPLSSSPVPPFAPPPPPGAAASRSGTPRMAKFPGLNKARKSARVLISPNKPKNGGITAGISRAGPVRDFGIGNGAESGAEDNDEYCASCGGEGTLLCCDGCTRSMHHACLEPPLDPDDDINGEWYCPQCLARRNKHPTDAPGFLGKVIRRVEDIIPKAFTLPSDVRSYFDGVRTGESGEYEEYGQPSTQQQPKMNRAGFFEEPNYKEPRDSKGKLITCYRCGKGTNGRDIIPCSYCPARWHLDCCDPPLAIPTRRRAGDKPGATWRCPLHIDQDLNNIGKQIDAEPGALGRVARPRKPKTAKPLDVDLPRGFRNNGIIEVELSKDEVTAIKEVDLQGQVYRIPEQGVKLDFIDRVKRSWYEDQTHPSLMGRPQAMRAQTYRPDGAAVKHTPTEVTFRRKEPDFYGGSQALAVVETAKANAQLRHKTFSEQQAILGLASMSQKGKGYSGDSLADLTNQLIIDALPDVGDRIERGEKQQLLRLQHLISNRLKILDGVEAPQPPPKAIQPRPAPLLAPKPSSFPATSTYLPVAPNYWPNQVPHYDAARRDSYGTSSDGSGSGLNGGSGVTPPSFGMTQIGTGVVQPVQQPGSRPQSQPAFQGGTASEQGNGGDAALDPRLFNGAIQTERDEMAFDGDIEMGEDDDEGPSGVTP